MKISLNILNCKSPARSHVSNRQRGVIPTITQAKDSVSFTGNKHFTKDSIGNKIPKSFEKLMAYITKEKCDKKYIIDNTEEGKVITLLAKDGDVDYVFDNQGTLSIVKEHFMDTNKIAEERFYSDDGKTVNFSLVPEGNGEMRLYHYNAQGALLD